MTIERNIIKTGSRYRVLVTRRPTNIFGGFYDTLEDAREARDRIEKENPPARPGRAPTGKTSLTSTQRRHLLFLQGLCQLCGECPPKPGRRSCADCLHIAAFKIAQRRAAA